MKLLRTVLAFGLLLALPGTVLANPATDKIRVAYAAQCHDFMTGDWTSFYNQMTPDYTGRGSDGTVMTRAQVTSSMKRYSNTLKVTACDPEIRAVNASGNQFATTVLLKLSAIALSPMGKFAKKGDQLESDTLAIDTWTQRNDGTLLLSASVAKGTQSAVNGKVIAKRGSL